MKPAIFWTLVPGWSRNGTGWRVMAVTSEKPGRMIYGRDDYGVGTHHTARESRGRFESEAAAAAAIAGLIKIVEDHEREGKPHKEALARISHAEHAATRLYFQGIGA